MLGEFVRVGQIPPPPVILCAIAEAESIGHHGLASDIVRVFIAPVVYQAELARARPAAPVYEPPLEPAPRTRTTHNPSSNALTNEQIQAMLDRDPQRFVEHATRAPQVIEVDAVETPVVDAPRNTTVGLALPSPIDGIDAINWSQFCDRLSRETPVYHSSRHVGQYRQRKERLLELGIEPQTLVGSEMAQRQALDTDLADAHHHASASGLAETHVGRRITLPVFGHDDPHTITLSGVLGVIQAAGLEGAVGWLESSRDRQRFPHTTRAFLNTNGMF